MTTTIQDTRVFLQAMADSLARHDGRPMDDLTNPVIFVLTDGHIIAWRYKKFVREVYARAHRDVHA